MTDIETVPKTDPKYTKLDVGCGNHCLPDAIGIDIASFGPGQVVHDMNITPWPLPGNRFGYVRCQHVIEHMRNLHGVVREIHRVATSGAIVDFITPHYSSYASWGDPTHLHHFARGSISQLFQQSLRDHEFEVIETKLKFTGSLLDFPGWLIYKLSPKKYEKYFAWRYPCNEIHVKVKIRK